MGSLKMASEIARILSALGGLWMELRLTGYWSGLVRFCVADFDLGQFTRVVWSRSVRSGLARLACKVSFGQW